MAAERLFPARLLDLGRWTLDAVLRLSEWRNSVTLRLNLSARSRNRERQNSPGKYSLIRGKSFLSPDSKFTVSVLFKFFSAVSRLSFTELESG